MKIQREANLHGLVWLLTLLFFLIAFLIAWKWVKPIDFIGVIIFLKLWFILGWIGHQISVLMDRMFRKFYFNMRKKRIGRR